MVMIHNENPYAWKDSLYIEKEPCTYIWEWAKLGI